MTVVYGDMVGYMFHINLLKNGKIRKYSNNRSHKQL